MTQRNKGGGRRKAVRVRTAKRRRASSTRWLQRQLNDPYVQEAQAKGYRSRAAFKLLELDAKHELLKPGMRVVDLGAAPGGWTRVVADVVAPARTGGRVVALDILEMEPIPEVEVLQLDFLDPAAPERLKAALGGPADLVLSDLSPSTTGHAGTDHLRIMAMAEAAYDFAEQVLAPGGAFVAKVFHGGAERGLLDRLKRAFDKVRHVKPPASRRESKEIYVVATGFRGTAAG